MFPCTLKPITNTDASTFIERKLRHVCQLMKRDAYQRHRKFANGSLNHASVISQGQGQRYYSFRSGLRLLKVTDLMGMEIEVNYLSKWPAVNPMSLIDAIHCEYLIDAMLTTYACRCKSTSTLVKKSTTFYCFHKDNNTAYHHVLCQMHKMVNE